MTTDTITYRSLNEVRGRTNAEGLQVVARLSVSHIHAEDRCILPGSFFSYLVFFQEGKPWFYQLDSQLGKYSLYMLI